MLVGEGDLPRSGASRRIRGLAYADLDGPLWRLRAANAARLLRETGRRGDCSPCGLPDSMIQIKIASSSGAQSQRISRRLGQPRRIQGMRRASSRCWSSQRARSSQSLTPGKAGRRTMHQGTDKQTAIRHCLCIFAFRNMTCSPGLADGSVQCHRFLQVRMPKWESGRAGPSCTDGRLR